MNFNMDRMNMLAGLEEGEKKLLTESPLNESDEARIRAIIREELETALEDALSKRDEGTFNKARKTRSLSAAMNFANTNATKFGGWRPAPTPGENPHRGSSMGLTFTGVGFK